MRISAAIKVPVLAEPGKEKTVIEIDLERYTIKAGGRDIATTPKSFEILRLLAEADGRVLSRQNLALGLWGDAYRPGDLRTVDQHIARLRTALDKERESVVTVTGRGYRAVNVTMVNAAPTTVAKVSEVKRTGKRTQVVLTVNGTPRHLVKGARVTL